MSDHDRNSEKQDLVEEPQLATSSTIEALQLPPDIPSPTESQVIGEAFEFHCGLSEEDIQIRQFENPALRHALKEVVPTLTRKEQWYAWRRATHSHCIREQYHPNSQKKDEKGHVRRTSKPDLEVPHNRRSSLASDDTDKHEDLSIVERELEQSLFEDHEEPHTPYADSNIEPIVLGPEGNPFAGNSRSKYLAISGLDLLILAEQWTNSPSQIDPQLRYNVECHANEKMIKLKCDLHRGNPPNAEVELIQVMSLSPPSQIMYLTWPGPHPVATVALDEYRDYLEEISEVFPASEQRLSHLAELPSEVCIQEMNSDTAFWGDFSAKMGLLSPEAYHDPPEDWFNEAGMYLDDVVSEAIHGYIGPVLYPDWCAGYEVIDKWKEWHGSELDKERERRALIQLIDTADFENQMRQEVQQEQYVYLQGLDAVAVAEYYDSWRNNNAYFQNKSAEVFNRWGIPKGLQIANESLEADDEDLGRSHEMEHGDHLKPPKIPVTTIIVHATPLTPTSPLPRPFSPSQPSIPGLTYFSTQCSRATTPVPIERPPIDVVDIGPQQSQEIPRKSVEPLDRRLSSYRQSSPPYTERSLAPSPATATDSLFSFDEYDTEMQDAPRLPSAQADARFSLPVPTSSPTGSLMPPPSSPRKDSEPRLPTATSSPEPEQYVSTTPRLFRSEVGHVFGYFAEIPTLDGSRDLETSTSIIRSEQRDHPPPQKKSSQIAQHSTSVDMDEASDSHPPNANSSLKHLGTKLSSSAKPQIPPLPVEEPELSPSSRPSNRSSNPRSNARSKSRGRIEKVKKTKSRTISRAVSTKEGLAISRSEGQEETQTTSTKVKDAVRKIEEAIVRQTDGSPPRRSGRIRGRKEGLKGSL